MIELTPTFKEAIKSGPLKYLIQISDDDGVSWQDLPDGAQAISPLGVISGETEIEPFSFVGADCEITCYNRDGFWTNSAKTGKLDTGNAVKFRLKEAPQSIDNEWVQLIEGYIDLASVTNYRTAFTCVFTVRGQLNVLDTVLANYVLADRPAQYPHKFSGWLSITGVAPSHPVGLFELKYEDGKVSWDNGVGVRPAGEAVTLYGQSGNTITVIALDYSLPEDATISQWIAVKSVNGVLGIYQPQVSMPLRRFKSLIYNSIDLNLDGIDSIPVRKGDTNILNHVPEILQGSASFTLFNPVHVLNIDANRWLVSFDGGALTGNYIITLNTLPNFRITSFLKFDPSNLGATAIMVNAYRPTNPAGNFYLLCEETATRQHGYRNTITSWKIYKYTTALSFVGVYAGTGELYYNSFAGYLDTAFYAVIKTSATKGKINRITISGAALAYAIKSPEYFPGCSTVPGDLALEQFYLFFTAYPDVTDNRVKVYLVLHDIANDLNYVILTEIDNNYDPLADWQMGPVGCARRDIMEGGKFMVRERLGIYVLVGPISYNTDTGIYQPLNSDKNKLHEIYVDDVLQPIVRYAGEVEDYLGHVSTGQQLYFYCDRINASTVGMTIEWMSGLNVGETRTITAHETIYLVTTEAITKITMDTALPYAVTGVASSRDQFRIYLGSFSLSGASYRYNEYDYKVDFIKTGPGAATFYGQSYTTGIFANREEVRNMADNEVLYKNNMFGYPLAGDIDDSGTRLLIASRDNLQFAIVNQIADGPEQYPEISLADFEDKTLREAVQEAAISANCHLMPSEHNKRLSLIYRGKAAVPSFTLANTEYKDGPRATPYFDYDAVELNGKRAGIFYAGNKQRDISLSSQCTPPAYSQSLAYDILEHIGSGNRTHEIQAIGRVELEPGDEGYLELEDGTTKQVMILGHTTDPETLDRSMIIREI